MMARVTGLWVEAAGRAKTVDKGAVAGQTATKQLLSSAGLPCIIYYSTG